MKKILMCTLLALTLTTTSAHALMITEVGGNNSLATAQNIDNFFSLGANSDIGNATTIPWVSISGVGNNAWDFFDFNVATAGSVGIFDIDYGMNQGVSFDPWLNLYNSVGSRLAYDDDASTSLGAGGSIHSYDSYLTYTFSETGNYAIAVGRYSYGYIGEGQTYELQVSLNNHPLAGSNEIDASAVPEPASMFLFGTGLVGAALRKKFMLA